MGALQRRIGAKKKKVTSDGGEVWKSRVQGQEWASRFARKWRALQLTTYTNDGKLHS